MVSRARVSARTRGCVRRRDRRSRGYLRPTARGSRRVGALGERSTGSASGRFHSGCGVFVVAEETCGEGGVRVADREVGTSSSACSSASLRSPKPMTVSTASRNAAAVLRPLRIRSGLVFLVIALAMTGRGLSTAPRSGPDVERQRPDPWWRYRSSRNGAVVDRLGWFAKGGLVGEGAVHGAVLVGVAGLSGVWTPCVEMLTST